MKCCDDVMVDAIFHVLPSRRGHLDYHFTLLHNARLIV